MNNRCHSIWQLSLLAAMFSLACGETSTAQPSYDLTAMQRENLNRGVVAVHIASRLHKHTTRATGRVEKFLIARHRL